MQTLINARKKRLLFKKANFANLRGHPRVPLPRDLAGLILLPSPEPREEEGVAAHASVAVLAQRDVAGEVGGQVPGEMREPLRP